MESMENISSFRSLDLNLLRELAESPNTDASVLMELINTEYTSVLFKIVRHPNSTEEVLIKIMNSDNPLLARRAKRRLLNIKE
jgi:hypothetical protein